MNLRHCWLTFRKDGTELLRDRRTLFVNLVLPVLLYPLLALIGLQTIQLTTPSDDERPRVLIGQHLPPALRAELAAQADGMGTARPFQLVTLDPADDAELQSFCVGLLSGGTAAHFRSAEARYWLRRHDAVLAIGSAMEWAGQSQGRRQVLLIDNAHRDYQQITPLIRQAFVAAEEHLFAELLNEFAIPPELRQPLAWEQFHVAPRSAEIRTALAGVIPLILVVMALSGAFYPAMDLIAGERERGTLETLLSWPADRAGVFVGKLLLVMSASLITVLLNLLSLGLTGALIGSKLAASDALGAGFTPDPSSLLVAVLLLVPVTLSLATLALALAGLAASFKEAQNYLSPLFLVVMAPAMVVLTPHVAPHPLLDLVPVLGPLVVLKACLQSGAVPWGHVVLTCAASVCVCVVLVAWSLRLLADERFLYPHLARRRPGRAAGRALPSGMAVLLLFGGVLGTFFLTAILAAGKGALAQVAVPLIGGVLLPTLLFIRFGGYQRQAVLPLTASPRNSSLSLLLIPLALGLSLCLGLLQMGFVALEDQTAANQQIRQVVQELRALGGLPLLLICLALVPACCEEVLFRGPLLQGLRGSIGRLSAVVVSSFFFAAMHASPARFFPQFTLGLLLAAVTLRSRSLVPAIIIHAGHNGLALLLDPSVRGLDPSAAGGDSMNALLDELSQQFPLIAPWIDSQGFAAVAWLAGGLFLLLIGPTILVIRSMQAGHDASTPTNPPPIATRDAS